MHTGLSSKAQDSRTLLNSRPTATPGLPSSSKLRDLTWVHSIQDLQAGGLQTPPACPGVWESSFRDERQWVEFYSCFARCTMSSFRYAIQTIVGDFLQGRDTVQDAEPRLRASPLLRRAQALSAMHRQALPLCRQSSSLRGIQLYTCSRLMLQLNSPH